MTARTPPQQPKPKLVDANLRNGGDVFMSTPLRPPPIPNGSGSDPVKHKSARKAKRTPTPPKSDEFVRDSEDERQQNDPPKEVPEKADKLSKGKGKEKAAAVPEEDIEMEGSDEDDGGSDEEGDDMLGLEKQQPDPPAKKTHKFTYGAKAASKVITPRKPHPNDDGAHLPPALRANLKAHLQALVDAGDISLRAMNKKLREYREPETQPEVEHLDLEEDSELNLQALYGPRIRGKQLNDCVLPRVPVNDGVLPVLHERETMHWAFEMDQPTVKAWLQESGVKLLFTVPACYEGMTDRVFRLVLPTLREYFGDKVSISPPPEFRRGNLTFAPKYGIIIGCTTEQQATALSDFAINTPQGMVFFRPMSRQLPTVLGRFVTGNPTVQKEQVEKAKDHVFNRIWGKVPAAVKKLRDGGCDVKWDHAAEKQAKAAAKSIALDNSGSDPGDWHLFLTKAFDATDASKRTGNIRIHNMLLDLFLEEAEYRCGAGRFEIRPAAICVRCYGAGHLSHDCPLMAYYPTVPWRSRASGATGMATTLLDRRNPPKPKEAVSMEVDKPVEEETGKKRKKRKRDDGEAPPNDQVDNELAKDEAKRLKKKKKKQHGTED